MSGYTTLTNSVTGKRIRRFIGTPKQVKQCFNNPHKSKNYLYVLTGDGFPLKPHREKQVTVKVISSRNWNTPARNYLSGK